jgi:murein L,D-transpeptidase YcbB/YkuD
MLTTVLMRVAAATAAIVALAATVSSAGAQTTPPATGTPSAAQETGAIPEKRADPSSSPAAPAAQPSAPTAQQTAMPPSETKPAETTTDSVANAQTPAAPSGTPPAASTEGSTPGATTPAAPAAATPTPPASAPASTTNATPEAAPATTAQPAPAVTPPAPPVDPVVADVRTWLQNAANTSNANKDDAAAAGAFYGARTEGPLWVDAQGFTAKAKAAIEEINKADDWGLSADAFELPRFNVTSPSTGALAEAEARLSLELLKYVRYARGGRINLASLSRILDLKPPVKDPNTVMTELAAASAVDAYLRDQHPKHPQFKLLHKALLKARGPADSVVEVDPALKISLPATREMLKVGIEHPNVALLRQRMKVPAEGGAQETLFDEKLELALKAYQVEKGLKATGELTGATRKSLNREVDALRAPDPERGTQLIVLNMERWRWMPEDLGRVYVWNNIPEYITRTIKGDEVIFKERIIVGLPQWATPVFSETMKTIVFNPSWGMPDGIKTRELAPRLRSAGGGFLFFGGGGGGNIIRAYGLDVYRGGRKIDPDSVDWTTADVRAYSFIQPPGGKNPLGMVKFMFPNRHDVYMHDTIERSLFQQPSRALSHGCIRVQNPRRFAEILLAEANGLDADGVADVIAGGGEVKLKNPIPVHNAYFTAVADDDGHVATFGDLYGHDSRLSAALTGRALRPEPQGEVIAVDGAPAGDATQRKGKKKVYKSPDTLADVISGFWMN